MRYHVVVVVVVALVCSLKSGKVVIVLNGRYAGHKAVIVRNHDDGTPERPYGHAVIAGVARYPRRVARHMSNRKIAARSRIRAFVKVVNFNHLMPTRYVRWMMTLLIERSSLLGSLSLSL